MSVSKGAASHRVKVLCLIALTACSLALGTGISLAADYPPSPGPSLSPAPENPLADATKDLPPVPPTSAAVPVIETTVQLGVPTNIDVLIDGKIVRAVLTVTNTGGAGGGGNTVAEIKGPDWSVTIRSTAASTDTGGNSSQTITFERGVGASISGTGFAPFTLVIVYIFSDPIKIGEVLTDAKGSFSGNFVIPEGLNVGEHTLQLSGQAPNGQVRTASVLVQVKKKELAKPGVSPKPTPSATGSESAEPAVPTPTPTTVSLPSEREFPLRWIIAILLVPTIIWLILLRRRRKEEEETPQEKLKKQLDEAERDKPLE